MIFYWWPVWSVGFLLGGLTSLVGSDYLNSDRGRVVELLSGSTPGILFVALLLLTFILTTMRIRGLFANLAIIVAALLVIAFAGFGFLDGLLVGLFNMSVHMTSGFYYLFSTGLFLVWFVSVFVLDRFAYWQVNDERLEHRRVFRKTRESIDLRGFVVHQQNNDLVRHTLFGFGSRDLKLHRADDVVTSLELRNILNAGQKAKKLRVVIAGLAPPEPIEPGVSADKIQKTRPVDEETDVSPSDQKLTGSGETSLTSE